MRSKIIFLCGIILILGLASSLYFRKSPALENSISCQQDSSCEVSKTSVATVSPQSLGEATSENQNNPNSMDRKVVINAALSVDNVLKHLDENQDGNNTKKQRADIVKKFDNTNSGNSLETAQKSDLKKRAVEYCNKHSDSEFQTSQSLNDMLKLFQNEAQLEVSHALQSAIYSYFDYEKNVAALVPFGAILQHVECTETICEYLFVFDDPFVEPSGFFRARRMARVSMSANYRMFHKKDLVGNQLHFTIYGQTESVECALRNAIKQKNTTVWKDEELADFYEH